MALLHTCSYNTRNMLRKQTRARGRRMLSINSQMRPLSHFEWTTPLTVSALLFLTHLHSMLQLQGCAVPSIIRGGKQWGVTFQLYKDEVRLGDGKADCYCQQWDSIRYSWFYPRHRIVVHLIIKTCRRELCSGHLAVK